MSLPTETLTIEGTNETVEVTFDPRDRAAGWKSLLLPISLTRAEAERRADSLAQTHDVYSLSLNSDPPLRAFPFTPLGVAGIEPNSYLIRYREAQCRLGWRKVSPA